MVRKRDLPNGDFVVWPQAQLGVETVTHRVGQEGKAALLGCCAPFPSQQPYHGPAAPVSWPQTPAREGAVEGPLGPGEPPESERQETREPRLSGQGSLSADCLSPQHWALYKSQVKAWRGRGPGEGLSTLCCPRGSLLRPPGSPRRPLPCPHSAAGPRLHAALVTPSHRTVMIRPPTLCSCGGCSEHEGLTG